ncbi:hypothetical protein C8J56DRAFT_163582 [Mycena floridula]|nr:hypothetical protein C8J56DRAFT_163582 [Mycena floridula]
MKFCRLSNSSAVNPRLGALRISAIHEIRPRLFKTYFEKRSFGHLLVNFTRIWVIHVALNPSTRRLGRCGYSHYSRDSGRNLATSRQHGTTQPILRIVSSSSHRPRPYVHSHILRRHSGNSNQLAFILGIVQFDAASIWEDVWGSPSTTSRTSRITKSTPASAAAVTELTELAGSQNAP